MYLFSLIFLLLKVAIQASAYSFALFKLARLYARQQPISWVAQVHQRPALRRSSRLLIVAALLAFSYTYWGNHGLGDYARIPLGHGEAIEEIDLSAFFEATVPYEHPTDQPVVECYQVTNDVLCAKASGDFYFTYDLATKTSHTFTSPEEYNSYAASQALPLANQLESFDNQYHHYWGGWRFWLLA